ncbi:MAG: protein kinase [Anaerolineae bacterium]
MTPQDRLLGLTLGGRYTIESFVGRGGLAVVYKGRDRQWDAVVAVKVLPEFFAADAEHRQRFQREATTMANLEHPNIVAVRDYGQAEGITYFIMDYAGRGTLEDRLVAPMSLPEAWSVLEPIAAAVAYAHRQGVVHRDLKPSNILYDADWRPLVTDFGIARLMEESGLTHTRESLGTPEYMAPEQAREAALAGVPADVYALGIILFQSMTGQTPFQGNSAIEIIEKHKYAAIPSARAFNPHLPPACDEFFQRVLAKEPASRVQTVDEMIGLVRLMLAGQPLPVNPRVAAPLPAPMPAAYNTPSGMVPPVSQPWPVYQPPPARPRSWLSGIVIMLVILALAAAAVVAYVVLSRPRPDQAYAAGLACAVQEEWICCRTNFEQVLLIDGSYRDAAVRLEDCRRRQIEAEQSQELRDAWSEIARCKAAADWTCVQEQADRILTSLAPGDVGARNEYAVASLRQAEQVVNDEPETAFEMLQHVKDLEVDPLPEGFTTLYDRLNHYLTGAAAYARGEWQAAITSLTKVQDFRNSRALIYDGHVHLCQAALKAGDLNGAQQAVKDAQRIKPDGAEAQACATAITDATYDSHVHLCQVALQAGDLNGAQQAVKDAQQIKPDGVEAKACATAIADATYESQMQQAQASLGAGRWQEAIDRCKQALAIKSSSEDAQACLVTANDGLYRVSLTQAQASMKKCQLTAAIQAFNQALQVKPNDKTAQDGAARARQLQAPVTQRVADSYDDFSSTQGRSGWYYYARVGGTLQEIGWAGNAYWWDRREGSRIQQEGQHPGSNMEAVRRWRSSVNGKISVLIRYYLQDGRGYSRVTLLQNGSQVWGQSVSSLNELSAQVTLDVAVGTNLDLVLNNAGSQTNDFTLVRMTIDRQISQCTPQ